MVLDELVGMRKLLRALKLAVDNAQEYVAEALDERKPFVNFTIDRRKITLPGDMMVKLMSEIAVRATEECLAIEKKFKDWSVDPCFSEEDES